jgi:hypothetical protein
MNPQLYNLAKSGKKSQFITLYKSLFSVDDTAAGVGYNAYVSQIKGSTMGGSSSGGSGGSGGGSWLGDLLGVANNGVKLMAETSGKLLESQFGKEEKQNAPGAAINALAQGGLNPIEVVKSGSGAAFDAIVDQLKSESELLSEVNSKVGISGELSDGLRKDMVAASVEASKYGVTLKDIGELYTGMSEKSGKFALVNKKLIDEAVPVATALGKTMGELAETISEFEKVGLGADKTIKQISQSNTNSIGLGLNAKKIATDIQSNIGKLNEYGFQNGYKGLERMVQKATEFRMEMSSVTAIADKVFSPEGAIDLAANLQVLGGAMGDFNDPIKLMYEATNNVGGLQDALIGAASGLATYNQEQGRFEITGVNLRKAKEMAGALGITMGELTKTSIAAAERSSATAALMGRGFDIPEKDKEFLINMARMDGGEMKIVVPESLQAKFGETTEIALDSITEEQTKALQDYQKKLDSMDSKSIAMSQLTETQQLVRGMDVVATYLKARAAAIGRGTAEGLVGKQVQDFKDAVGKYDAKLDTKKIENDEKNTKEKVTGFLNNPAGTTMDAIEGWFKEKLGMKTSKTEAPTAPTTQTTNSNVTVTLKSEGPFTDSFNRELARDSSLAMKWADAAPNSLTTPNSAIRK